MAHEKTVVLALALTEEEHAKLLKLTERVGRSVSPKKLFTATDCLRNYIKTASVDDEWTHPTEAAKKKAPPQDRKKA